MAVVPATPAGGLEWAGALGAGTTVLVSPYVMHRSAQQWHRPEAFLPERWLPALAERPAMAELSGMGSSGAYLPFGAGPRNCIGTGAPAGILHTCRGQSDDRLGCMACQGVDDCCRRRMRMHPSRASMASAGVACWYVQMLRSRDAHAGFAMTEALLVLTHALGELRFATLPGTSIPQDDARITLRPKTVPLVIERTGSKQ